MSKRLVILALKTPTTLIACLNVIWDRLVQYDPLHCAPSFKWDVLNYYCSLTMAFSSPRSRWGSIAVLHAFKYHFIFPKYLMLFCCLLRSFIWIHAKAASNTFRRRKIQQVATASTDSCSCALLPCDSQINALSHHLLSHFVNDNDIQ